MLLTFASTVTLGLFGLHCHYHGTFGPYTQQMGTAAAATDDDWTPLLPVFLFAAALALYALGPMRLSGGGETAALDADLWRSLVPVGQELTVRSILLAVGWLCVFGVARALPRLVNSVGMGWLLWYAMANGAIAAVFLRWWLREVVQTTKSGDVDADGAEPRRLIVDEEKGVVATVLLC